MKIKMNVLIAFALLALGSEAQPINEVTTGFGTQGWVIGLQKNLAGRTGIIIETGLDMEGMAKKLNDPFLGLGYGYRLVNGTKNNLQVAAVGGLEYVRDDLYSTRIGYAKVELVYTRYFGHEAHHGVSFSAGYMYGKGRYHQSSNDAWFRTELVAYHQLAPVYAQLSYCYRF